MSPRTPRDFLKDNSLFAALPDKDVDALATAAREHAFRAREYIFLEGDPAHALWIVRAGRVRIFKQSRAGKDVVLELLGPGEVFGGVAVIERRPYPATAQAVMPTEVVAIPADVIAAVVERHPSVVRALALLISRRLRSAHDSVRALATEPAEARLAASLLRLMEHEAAGREEVALSFHLTRQNLADMAGTTVETAIRVVSRWLKEGLVAETGTRLVLRDAATLRQIAEGDTD
jgi:CRP/FNR family transcriptional regulator